MLDTGVQRWGEILINGFFLAENPTKQDFFPLLLFRITRNLYKHAYRPYNFNQKYILKARILSALYFTFFLYKAVCFS